MEIWLRMLSKIPVGDSRRLLTRGGLLLVSCAVSCAVTCAMGCSDEGIERAAVTGSIRLDGEPVQSGTIAFYPAEGTRGPSAGGLIEGGRYRIDSAKGVVLGKSRVEINSSRKSGRMIPDAINPNAMMEEYVEGIPSQYNTESTLIREIESGENQIDFDLSSSSK